MAWVKIDDAITDHPKLLDAESPALLLALQVAALCYCNRNLTDGFIPRAKASMLLPIGDTVAFVNGMQGSDATWQRVIDEAVSIGLWQEAACGYQIHDYLDYQPSREDSESKRVESHQQKVAAGKARARSAGRDGGRFTAGQDQQTPAETPANDQRATSPVPVPVPQVQDPTDTRVSGSTPIGDITIVGKEWEHASGGSAPGTPLVKLCADHPTDRIIEAIQRSALADKLRPQYVAGVCRSLAAEGWKPDPDLPDRKPGADPWLGKKVIDLRREA